ncbi:hypothetical protein B0J14DRAFT_654704 [Halenospora varia]|nr:hypothetical protein B0J14DRAFT_654704 [Halenospora varia]
MVSFTLPTLTLALAALSSALPSTTKRQAVAPGEFEYTISSSSVPPSTPGTAAHFNATRLIFIPHPAAKGFTEGTGYSMSVLSLVGASDGTFAVTANYGDNGDEGFGTVGDDLHWTYQRQGKGEHFFSV